MFKRLSTVVAVLALASAVKYTGSWGALLLPLAVLLYPLAVSVYVAILLSPFVMLFVAWLVWRWVRDGRLPASVTSRAKRLRKHRLFKHPVFNHPVFRYRIRVERRSSAGS